MHWIQLNCLIQSYLRDSLIVTVILLRRKSRRNFLKEKDGYKFSDIYVSLFRTTLSRPEVIVQLRVYNK
jgi:hypothetical protein